MKAGYKDVPCAFESARQMLASQKMHCKIKLTTMCALTTALPRMANDLLADMLSFALKHRLHGRFG